MIPALPPGVVESIGLVAGVITTTCWVPQAVKILRTRETKAISLTMQSMVCFGCFLWLVYGLLIVSWPLILSNVFSFALISMILALKLRYG